MASQHFRKSQTAEGIRSAKKPKKENNRHVSSERASLAWGDLGTIWVIYHDLLRGATFRSDGVRRVLRVAFCHHALRPPKMILLLAMLKCQSSKVLSVQSSMLSNWLANHGHCIFFWCGWSKCRAASVFALNPRFFPDLDCLILKGFRAIDSDVALMVKGFLRTVTGFLVIIQSGNKCYTLTGNFFSRSRIVARFLNCRGKKSSD